MKCQFSAIGPQCTLRAFEAIALIKTVRFSAMLNFPLNTKLIGAIFIKLFRVGNQSRLAKILSDTFFIQLVGVESFYQITEEHGLFSKKRLKCFMFRGQYKKTIKCNVLSS